MADQSGRAKGGRARAEQLSPARRKEIAQAAAVARWGAERVPAKALLKSSAVRVKLDATLSAYLDDLVDTGLFEEDRRQ